MLPADLGHWAAKRERIMGKEEALTRGNITLGIRDVDTGEGRGRQQVG